MTHSSSRLLGCAAVLGGCLVLYSKSARAEAGASRLHLQYEAAEGCPTRAEFLQAVESRVQTSWIDRVDTRSFSVRVERSPDGAFLGRLEIRRPNRPPSAREIHDDSCKAVARSLAVFIAIAVDPASEGEAAPEESRPREERAEDGEHEGAPVPGAALAEALPPSSFLRPPRAAAPPTEPAPQTLWSWRAGYAVSYALSPRSSWGGRVSAELGQDEEPGRVAPALRLSWGWSDFSTFPPLTGEARFRRITARVEGCARVRFPPFEGVACAGLDAGTLTAAAPELPRFFQVTTRWLAPTGTLRAAWAMAPWLEVEASAGVLVPLERPRFTVQDPPRIVYRAPVTLFEGMLGIAAVARFR